MQLDFKMNLTQQQKLAMTQNMQLSIKILQMSSYDLREYIDKEFEENPILEGDFEFVNEEAKFADKIDFKEMIKYLEFDSYGSHNYQDYNSEDEVSPFNFISEKHSLKDFLYDQVNCSIKDKSLKAIVEYMIESLDARGYLDYSLEDICKDLKITEKEGQEALDILQGLEPDGIGARDLRECLEIQLSKKGLFDSNLDKIISNFLSHIADNKYMEIAKELSITPKEAQDYGDIIKSLEPKPSRGFFTGDEVKFIIPDAFIRNIDGEFLVIMNDGVVPRLTINQLYRNAIIQGKNKDVEGYVKDKVNSAMMLIKSIEQRKGTLLRILEEVVVRQKDYFNKGKNYLKPMTLKDIADTLEMHESTVSRAIKDKYVLTSYGTIKIKDLFCSGIQAKSDQFEDVAVYNIKNKIKELIDGEDKKKPLSDQIICDKLNEDNLNISRRTVAKYREEMGIKSSAKRKRI
jgi:RNA polymerase sigma-54 factor